MDTELKIGAALAWTAAVVLSFLAAFDAMRWAFPLGVGCYASAACLTGCVVLRSCARVTRRAVYHQRRWDDTPGASVLQLLRSDDLPAESHSRN